MIVSALLFLCAQGELVPWTQSPYWRRADGNQRLPVIYDLYSAHPPEVELIPAPKKKIETRTDEGKLVIVKDGRKDGWNWYLEAKDYKWLLGMPSDRTTGVLLNLAEYTKLDGRQVIVTSRAGYFGIGDQKSLLVLEIKAKGK